MRGPGGEPRSFAVETGDTVDVTYDPGKPERPLPLFEATGRAGYDTALSAVVGTVWVAALSGLVLTL